MQLQHYNESIEFFEQFDAKFFDEERDNNGKWEGWKRNSAGELQLAATFEYDDNDGGTAWEADWL